MKKIIILFVLIAVVLSVWVFSLIKCEILTATHIAEFSIEQNNIISDISFKKIIRYSDSSAYVYCVSNDEKLGTTLIFAKEKDKWNLKSFETNWTKLGGNSDKRVWPYLWHY